MCVLTSACCASCATTSPAASSLASTWTNFPWACRTISRWPSKRAPPASAWAARSLASALKWPQRKKKKHDSRARERRWGDVRRKGPSSRPQKRDHRIGWRRPQALAHRASGGRQGQSGGDRVFCRFFPNSPCVNYDSQRRDQPVEDHPHYGHQRGNHSPAAGKERCCVNLAKGALVQISLV